MAKTRQQLMDEELKRMQSPKTSIPTLGTQRFAVPAQPAASTYLPTPAEQQRQFIPEQAKTFAEQQAAMQSRAVAPLSFQGLNSAAPAPTPTQPVPTPMAPAPVQPTPAPMAPSFASVNAQADREAQKAAAETNANMIIGKSGLPQGFALSPQGQLIPERQLRAGLQSAVTPMAPITPAMTNQQAMATAARVGTNVVTPMGTFSAPLNTNVAGVPGAPTIDQVQAGIDARAGQGRTVEAQAARARQVKQDQINVNQGLESAAQQAAKLQNELAGKVLPAQAAAMGGVDQEMVKRGLDPRTGQPLAGANQPVVPVKDANGTWMDQNTGKLITADAVLKRLDQQERDKESIDTARGLTSADDRTWLGKLVGFKNTAVYGYNPTTGEYRAFDNQAELNSPKNKQFRALTPEQQKAYDEGNKGKVNTGNRGGDMNPTTNPAPMGLSSAGPVNQQGISPQQQGPVTMVFPDGKKKQVPASEMSKWLALGGKVQQ